MKSNSSPRWPWVLLAIVVVAIVVVLFTLPLFPSKFGVPVYAPKGQVVAGFPQNLLLDKTASITKSYSIRYPSSTFQYTVEWTTTTSSQALAATYLAYFGAQNWQTISQQNSFSLRALYVSNGNDTANLSIVPGDHSSAVTLSYVTGMKMQPSLAQPYLSIHQGILVKDFPPQFILGVSTTVLSSSENPDPITGEHTVAAVYRSNQSLQALYSSYLSFFQKNGFLIITQSTSSIPLSIGANDSASGKYVSVSLQTVGSSSIAIVSLQTKMIAP